MGALPFQGLTANPAPHDRSGQARRASRWAELGWRKAATNLAAAVFALLFLGWARGEDPSSAFDQANQLYERGKFADAVQAYRELLAKGVASPSVYFNLGNAHFKSGELGRAIHSYLLAQQLAPRDPDIKANLEFARDSLTAVPGSSQTAPRSAFSILTLNELTAAAAFCLWVWLALLALGSVRSELKGLLRRYTQAAGILFGAFALWLASAAYTHFQSQPGVVVVPEAVVRYGPLEESQSFYTLRDGAEVVVIDRKDNWLQVRDAAGRTGWLREAQLATLGPSRD